MSARDDQPATVPPPVGEDDAYSATTKVGAMPADIREKLRAEGLLPDDPPDDPPAPHRPSTSLDERPSPPPPSPAVPGNIPALYSNAPPPKISSTKPPPPDAPASTIETPVAFAFLPAEGAPPSAEGQAAPAPASTDGLAPSELTAPDPPKPPSKLTLYLVAGFVVVALIVALLRLAG